MLVWYLLTDKCIGTREESETCSALRNIIERNDNIHKEGSIGDKLENTSEVVLDAQILKSTHESISKLLQASSEFNDGMYQNAIVRTMTHIHTHTQGYSLEILHINSLSLYRVP